MDKNTAILRNHRLAMAVWLLWFVSAASLLIFQASKLVELYRDTGRQAYPEIPGQRPAAVISIVDACKAEAVPGDILGVAFKAGSAEQHFLAYRLAYALYPLTVVSQSYENADAHTAIDKISTGSNPNVWLVFAPTEFVPPAEARIVAKLPLNALLYRSGDAEEP